ncbi:unnamed protein product, partial [Staurois parvus]
GGRSCGFRGPGIRSWGVPGGRSCGFRGRDRSCGFRGPGRSSDFGVPGGRSCGFRGPGRADIVNAGSGESGYSECGVRGERI